VQAVNDLLDRFKQVQAYMRTVPGLAGMSRRSAGKKAAAKRKKRR
jgi:hypothetical protein